MPHTRFNIQLTLLLATLSAACATEGASDELDAGSTDDAAPTELSTVCTGTCSEMSLQATFGATTRSFDRAFFGLSAPAASDSGEWEVYIETNSGDDAKCPTESSPTPLFLMTVSGMSMPASPVPLSATANLVDFEGALLTSSVFEKASAATLNWAAAAPCLECAQGTQDDHEGRMLAFDIEASFPGGTILGHGYATHCESLDKL